MAAQESWSDDWEDADPWDDVDRPQRSRETFGRATAQGILAIIGVFAFIALFLVWRQGTTTRDEVTSLTILLILLLVILLAEILLTRPIFDALFRRVPPGLEVTPDEDNFIVGCPGCGTVFTVTEDQLEAGSFDCHNCGRTGYVKDFNLNKGHIQQEVCRTCGNKYLEYRDDSECPICHTYNAY